ncbi:MAG: NADH:flavin oxidoreductase [Anaerolineae bacterium]|nr:NADH:flavin oxidoreductase [Anaerolineae bacterium]
MSTGTGLTLFHPSVVGKLSLRNRLMRSATCEYMADIHTGAPDARQREHYRGLGEGGVGLIVTGHLAVQMEGRSHVWMASMASDDLVPLWRETIAPAQSAGARFMAQINHAGASASFADNPTRLSPSGVPSSTFVPCRPYAASEQEIQDVIEAFGNAARRVREAGFDGVQLHGGHGYLVCQFLSPMMNLRDDDWGGDETKRCAFLVALTREMRRQVGPDYPLWLKLGVAGSEASGLTKEMGARAGALAAESGVDCIEITTGLGVPAWVDAREEGCYRPMAEAVREQVGPDYPLALVGGFSTLAGMQAMLDSDLVQMISLSRPLIAEPDLPLRLEQGLSDRAICVRCNRCRSERPGDGIACHREGGGLDPRRPLENLDILRG